MPYSEECILLATRSRMRGQLPTTTPILSMEGCACNGTLVATVATAADSDRLARLAASVVSAGFPCLVVLPTEPLELRGRRRLRRRALAFVLPPPSPPLRPRRRWCRGQAQRYASRLLELHRAALWRMVLERRLDLLAIDVAVVMASSPLDHVHSLATESSSTVDVVGTPRAWMLRHDLLWVRSTHATRALAQRAENRTWGAHVAWDEELAYSADFVNVSCCHTQCLRAFVMSNSVTGIAETTHRPDCQPEDAEPRHTAPPPEGTRVRWFRSGWRSKGFNRHVHQDRFARCTMPRNGCFWRGSKEDAAPANTPAFQYSSERMYGAAAAFASPCFGWLRGIAPTILPLEGSAHAAGRNLFGHDLGVEPQGSLNDQVIMDASGGVRSILPSTWPVRFFNPSVVVAPPRLCPRCAYLMTLRADCHHQCDATSPYSTDFKAYSGAKPLFRGTVLLVLDAALHRLGWTWLLAAPRSQIAPHSLPHLAGLSRNGSLRFMARPGEANGFAPVHSNPVYDVRLMWHRKRLLATAIVPLGDARPSTLSLVHVQVTAKPTADGGLNELRAWSSRRVVSTVPWVLGRNQALFEGNGGRGDGGIGADAGRSGQPPQLMVQPWLGMVASLDRLNFAARRVVCLAPNISIKQWLLNAASHAAPVRAVGAILSSLSSSPLRGSFGDCGSHASGTQLETDAISSTGSAGGAREGDRGGKKGAKRARRQLLAELVTNQSFGLFSDSVLGGGPLPRLSPTAHLIRVHGSRAADGRPCHALLGVGHLHRGEGRKNHQGCHAGQCKSRFWYSSNGWHRRQPFEFGYLYTHFFYTLAPTRPHRLTATTGELCIGAAQDGTDCESTQFVSGVAPFGASASGKLLLAFGVNDCEAKAGVVALARVGAMLSVLPGEEAELCRLGM